ncbi:MAG: hypothetical protein S4CHLAM45_05220 [Chlamydiales bacterium]|nr:hypothetical protein [Chlamydiales bacterium]MCH9619937.1 hypothetical protein [Chlamydiales bacterium]MCH9622636.1 hypothetical protein [Chlamydiales bacterium]
MFGPKYLIRLDKKAFSRDQFVCLGSQLKAIIKTLSELIEPHVWFGADIDAISPMPKKLGIDSFQLRKIGDSYSLINLCENINQFLSGVFIAVKEKKRNFEYSELRVGTEDERFRSLNLDGVLIEIRAFDTSYYELYSDNLILIEKLSKIYEIKIDHL